MTYIYIYNYIYIYIVFIYIYIHIHILLYYVMILKSLRFINHHVTWSRAIPRLQSGTAPVAERPHGLDLRPDAGVRSWVRIGITALVEVKIRRKAPDFPWENQLNHREKSMEHPIFPEGRTSYAIDVEKGKIATNPKIIWMIWAYHGLGTSSLGVQTSQSHSRAVEVASCMVQWVISVRSIFTVTGWWLGTMEFYDFPFSNFIIPTDEVIFFRGVGSSTNQVDKSSPFVSLLLVIYPIGGSPPYSFCSGCLPIPPWFTAHCWRKTTSLLMFRWSRYF